MIDTAQFPPELFPGPDFYQVEMKLRDTAGYLHTLTSPMICRNHDEETRAVAREAEALLTREGLPEIARLKIEEMLPELNKEDYSINPAFFYSPVMASMRLMRDIGAANPSQGWATNCCTSPLWTAGRSTVIICCRKAIRRRKNILCF